MTRRAGGNVPNPTHQSSPPSSARPALSEEVGKFCDPKLFHLVRKITSSTNDQASFSAKEVLDVLLTNHREYRRKNQGGVLKGVEVALERLRGRGTDQQSQHSRVVQGLKRRPSDEGSSATSNTDIERPKRRRTNEEVEEEKYESEARAVESARANFEGNGMLNAGLRDRYQRVQREKDVVARAEAAAAAKAAAEEEKKKMKEQEGGEEDGSATPLATVPEEAVSPSPGTAPSGQQPKSPTKGAAETTSGGSTKKRRKKSGKSQLTRSSSQSSFPPMHGDMDFPTSSIQPSPRPTERYADLGGLAATLTQIRQIIEYPLLHPELFRHLGVTPPRGVLLRGPPGCGKTHLARSIGGEMNVPYFQVAAPELVSGTSGESEGRIRDLFDQAGKNAPSIVFIDEIDAVAPKRDGAGGASRGMEKRMVAQFLTSMDKLNQPQNTRNGASVLILGATNRPDSLDPALRRAGRFDREIVLGVPDERMREKILKVMTGDMRLEGTFDYATLARKTPGFVGADVRSLCKEAAVVAVERIFKTLLVPNVGADDGSDMVAGQDNERIVNKEDLIAKNTDGGGGSDNVSENGIVDGPAVEEVICGGDGNPSSSTPALPTPPSDVASVVPLTPAQLDPLYVTMSDFLTAIPKVQPSSKREGFATVPDVTWDDIGALTSIRDELTLHVLEPIRSPEKFEQLGLPLPAGVLLYGPPGCGKTLLAKAVARESGANFISVKGPELLDKYVGESERAVRVVFDRARSSSPCVVFFDELDSLCPRRGSDGLSGGGGVSERVVNQLLTEMDGLESRRSVFVIAATNRPELIDPAMLRPGRLDKLLYVPLPSSTDRVSILRALSSKIKLGPDVDLDSIGRSKRADGYSGADCAALLREAGLSVLRDSTSTSTTCANTNKEDNASAISTSGSEDTMSESKDREQLQLPTLHIAARHFDYAFRHVMPSVSKKDQARYDRIRDRMARARSRGGGARNGEDEEGGEGGSQSEKEVKNAVATAGPESVAGGADGSPT